MKGIGILPGDNLSYVDHLVPLCQILGFPLLVTDPWVKEVIELYYPPMPLILAQAPDYNLDPYLKGYELFVYVDFFRKAHGTFQFKEYTTTVKARSLFSFHGNPSKFLDIYWLEHLEDEDAVLVYGPQLQERLRAKGIRKTPLLCGNYRLEYYKEHTPFFDALLPFKKKGLTALYAPTWAGSSSFSIFAAEYSPFLKSYGAIFAKYQEYQLICKIHPYMRTQMPDVVAEIVVAHPEVHFLNDFPPIYPLLKQIDLYEGDLSSIGSDYLYFQQKRDPTFRPRYLEIFGEEKPLSQLKEEIFCAY